MIGVDDFDDILELLEGLNDKSYHAKFIWFLQRKYTKEIE